MGKMKDLDIVNQEIDMALDYAGCPIKRFDVSSVEEAIAEAGYDPTDPALVWNAGMTSEDGSCAIAVYYNGVHIASGWKDRIYEEDHIPD
jgi:hypothetical protein